MLITCNSIHLTRCVRQTDETTGGLLLCQESPKSTFRKRYRRSFLLLSFAEKGTEAEERRKEGDSYTTPHPTTSAFWRERRTCVGWGRC